MKGIKKDLHSGKKSGEKMVTSCGGIKIQPFPARKETVKPEGVKK